MLDICALYWLVSGVDVLTEEALVAIGEKQATGSLFVSPITSWELAIATQKSRLAGRPHLGDEPADRWFREAVRAIDAKVIKVGQQIACEAAQVALVTGHRDPGDCFLIATARVRKAKLVTRDGPITRIAANEVGYLDVIYC